MKKPEPPPQLTPELIRIADFSAAIYHAIAHWAGSGDVLVFILGSLVAVAARDEAGPAVAEAEEQGRAVFLAINNAIPDGTPTYVVLTALAGLLIACTDLGGEPALPEERTVQ